MRKPRKAQRLPPVRPNLGVEYAYQRRIDALLSKMAEAVHMTVMAVWRRKPPEMLATDESPASALKDAIDKLSREWEGRFDTFAREWGRKFSHDTIDHADRSFASHLRNAGFTVKFQMGRAANDILQATIHENVALIKSIPSEYFTQVEGIVMRGVTAGRDMHIITEELTKQLGVGQRRAEIIARDQSNKATAAITRARQSEVGIVEAEWLHSRGGRHPRRSHLVNDGKRYNVKTGWFDPDEKQWIWPGTLINCRCVTASIIPGLDD